MIWATKREGDVRFYEEIRRKACFCELPMFASQRADTIPPADEKFVTSYRKVENGEETEVVMENGKIVKLRINDLDIPESDYPKYAEMVEEMMNDVPEPPEPPMPPMPPTPPAPPTLSDPPGPDCFGHSTRSGNSYSTASPPTRYAQPATEDHHEENRKRRNDDHRGIRPG